MITDAIPIVQPMLIKFCTAQINDSVCTRIRQYCLYVWPSKQYIPGELKPYWLLRDELSVCNDLLLYGKRIVVPRSLQTFTLQKIHSGHLGMQRCRLRAGNTIWWPGLAKQILSTVHCHICSQKNPLVVEPMISLQLPAYPWQRVSSDLFEMKGNMCIFWLLIRFQDIQLPSTTTSTKVISVLNSVFAQHGIPEEFNFISDNGPQYSSQEMKEFALQYGFRHTTSNPHYPRGHGQAERALKTLKSLLLDTVQQSFCLVDKFAPLYPKL